MTYNTEDQLVSVGGINYYHNSDGYLWQKVGSGGTTTYTYSTRGELLTATLPDTRVISYVYDPLGRRIAKKINGTITEKYLWAGLTRLLAIYDGSDNLLMRFEYAEGRMPVSMVRSSTTYYLSYNQVGTLRAVYNSSGSIVKRVDYDSFGNIITDTAPSFSVPFGFAGGLHDRDTNLVHFGYRDYDPETGRWTAKDPIGFNGGALNLYGYCLEDPVNWIDPEGLRLRAKGTPEERQEIQDWLSQMAGTTVPMDSEGNFSCDFTCPEGNEELCNWIKDLINADDMIFVQFGEAATGGKWWSPDITVAPNPSAYSYQGSGFKSYPYSGPSILAHELQHAYDFLYNGGPSGGSKPADYRYWQDRAIGRENQVNDRTGRPLRRK